MKTNQSKIFAAIIAVLGICVAMIPKYIFPICESGDLSFFSSYEPVMRCFWFARIELFMGGLVVLSALILFFRPTPESHFSIGALLIGLGLVIILVSFNAVIGSTCGHNHSICQIGTKPAERIVGSIVVISGLIMVFFPGKRFEQK